MCMFSGTTYGWPPMVTAFASGFGIASEYLISVYRLSSGTRYPPSTYDSNSAPPSVGQVSGGRWPDSRACRTTRWLTPPPPATGFSTSWMSGYVAFNALNMASAASRSPPAVHQWKISSLRSSAFAIPPPRCVPAQYPATPATSAAMTTPTTIWETGAYVAPLLMPIAPPWEMKPAYAIAVKGRSDDFGVGAGASCQARRRHVPARVVRGSRTGPTRSGGEAFLDDHETFRAPRMRRPSTHVERLERPQLRGKNRSACGLSRPRVFGHRTERAPARMAGGPRPPRTGATACTPHAQPPPEPRTRARGWRCVPRRPHNAGPPLRPLSPVAQQCRGPTHRDAHGDFQARLRCG